MNRTNLQNYQFKTFGRFWTDKGYLISYDTLEVEYCVVVFNIKGVTVIVVDFLVALEWSEIVEKIKQYML